ncbi:MAG: hypothetical protein QW177_01185 [Candidatus Nitrosotenuis sp.]
MNKKQFSILVSILSGIAAILGLVGLWAKEPLITGIDNFVFFGTGFVLMLGTIVLSIIFSDKY